jgi:hypothetical protein
VSAAPPLWFTPPAAFAPLDLRPDAVDRVRELVRRTPALTGPQRLHLAALVETQVEVLRRAGTAWAGTCAVRVDGPPPRVSTALLAVAVRAVDCGGGSLLDALARHLPAGAAARCTAVVDLPLGRALEVVEESSVRTAASVLGHPRERTHRVHHAHLAVPHPGRRHLVVLSIGTGCPEDAEGYRHLLGAVGRSLSVDPPPVGGAVAAVLDPVGRPP